MKIALLVCDHVHPGFRENHGTYPDMFGQLLHPLKLEPFFVVDGQFPVVEEWDAFVVTGSKFSVYQPIDWILRLKELTQKAFELNKKYVGVCFGHQMIGHALGGLMENAEIGFMVGVHEFKVQSILPWMEPAAESYKMLMLCQDQVLARPEGSILLASSSDCPTAMFTVGDHFLGIQGHPEFSKGYALDVYESRTNLIGEEKIEKAKQSFIYNPDASLLGTWMKNFIAS